MVQWFSPGFSACTQQFETRLTSGILLDAGMSWEVQDFSCAAGRFDSIPVLNLDVFDRHSSLNVEFEIVLNCATRVKKVSGTMNIKIGARLSEDCTTSCISDLGPTFPPPPALLVYSSSFVGVHLISFSFEISTHGEWTGRVGSISFFHSRTVVLVEILSIGCIDSFLFTHGMK